MARWSKHGGALNAAELCRRLEALETERRAAIRNVKHVSKEQGQTSVPYHHIPQHAAEDFAQTTSAEVNRRRESQVLSSSRPSIGEVDDACQRNITRRQSLGPLYGLADGELRSSIRSSVASKHAVARSERTSVHYGQGFGPRASQSGLDMNKVLHKRWSEKSGHSMYGSLLGADEGFRRVSIREGVLTELANIESVLHEDVPVLAHKITRKHLEKRARADWTESDENVKGSKYDALKDLAAPFLRSLVKRGNVDNSTATTGADDLEKPSDGKSLPQRRPSFLARHFRKRTLV